MTKKNLPAGETSDEAIERVAPTPASFTVSLSSTSDDGDVDLLRAGFDKFIRTARRAGFTQVNGVLTGSTTARRDEAGELIPAEVFHLNAVDVEG